MESKKTLAAIKGAVVSGAVLFPFLAAAQPSGVPYMSVNTSLNIGLMLGKIRNYFFGAVIAACVFMALWAALDIVTAGDDENKIAGAKKRLKYAVMGLIVAAMSSALVSLLLSIVS
ncbi:MAG: hypothetical protein MUD10_04205 [Candidatus Pacebacteria bacterium]|nr:hypothetical protein [Candidatus Paceibacterota bacterium]